MSQSLFDLYCKYYKLFFGHRSLIRNKTQTLVMTTKKGIAGKNVTFNLMFRICYRSNLISWLIFNFLCLQGLGDIGK